MIPTRWPEHSGLALAALAALTIAGFLFFPGHTYLQSDTHIYLPMMERILDPRLLGNDIIAIHPHLAFTFYDEIAVALKWVTGLDFEPILQAQQILARWLGLVGIFLLASAAGLRAGAATFVAALYALGTTISGPAILTMEYEPIPRGTALPLLLLAMGLASMGRWVGAAAAAAVAFWFHPPTVWPVWLLLGGFALLPWNGLEPRERRRVLLILGGSVVLLAIGSKLQAGEREHQQFFATIPPDLEALQRMRAAYNWVGMWIGQWWLHYTAMLGLALGAWWRIRRHLPDVLDVLMVGLPVLGILSIPLSYLLLDVMKWIVIPQAQPGRALLWVTAGVILNGGIAAAHAAEERKFGESFLWLIIPFALPLHLQVLELAWPSTPLLATRLALAVGLAALAALLLRLPAGWAPVLACTVAMAADPSVGQVKNYPNLHTPALAELSAWARGNTALNAVFHFPDSGLELYPGIFRSRALRAVWVDRKGGGQVNFTYSLAKEWFRRYDATIAQPYAPWPVDRYRALPADYLVVKAAHRRDDLRPVYENSGYIVYALR